MAQLTPIINPSPAGAAAAGTLTGTVLAANVVTSSLTAIGTLVSGAVPASLVTAGTFGAGAYTFSGTLAVTAVLSLLNTAAPVSSPANTGQLYALAGALVYRGANGTITTIAAS